MHASGNNKGETDIRDRMTVINKVNDDSSTYFNDYLLKSFIIQCGNHLSCYIIEIYRKLIFIDY